MGEISIKEITLEGFRGIYNKNTLEFGNCRGIIFYGDNGTGKTSFSEGAEWLFYNEIEKLKVSLLENNIHTSSLAEEVFTGR